MGPIQVRVPVTGKVLLSNKLFVIQIEQSKSSKPTKDENTFEYLLIFYGRIKK